ncbi:SWI/SNF complex subunit SWI3D-like isoform X2 [Gastrolobium bilobum]|uniref:SWI/SNF complex subunit SWI3D-like isoform X2 n=1 Tax=Gastrolobium bilobum TaxID=150636 RepID=UPI002AB196EC|nr:SWI/SNF complex subunit SWI3D-like isoform X2 [Gastrolobium bilobum]
MDEKRRDVAALPPSNAANSPASEPASSRRRAANQKRKANALNASNSSSAPSKRITRDKALPPHSSSIHNGPLTRARQIPTNLSDSAATSSSAPGGSSASAPAAVKYSERAPPNGAFGGDSVLLAEEHNKESKWEALDAAIEAQFEAIRSRGSNAHVVPTHCGWFSWTDIHPIEKHTLTSFFSGKTENKTPSAYMEIRNYIMKKFHANPNVQIELKDLSELNVGDLDARQEVMDFLDYWGLINFHPFPSSGSAVASADDDGTAEKNSLLEKLYRFESMQFQPSVPKASLLTPAMNSGLFPESTIAEEWVKQEGVEYHCNSCSADCSRKRYHCQKQADFDLCTDCFGNGKFGSGMSSLDFILMEPAEVPGVSGGKWTDQETLLLLEALELYKENWNEIAEHVATKSKAQCILHFVQMPIQDAFVDCGDDVDASCKETADPVTTNSDSSVEKNASELIINKTGDSIEGHVLTAHDETSKAEDVNQVKDIQETPKLEDVSDKKTSEGTSKSEDSVKVKFGQETDKDYVLKALEEAFAAVGYSPGPQNPSSFADVGNPVMALAVFLAHLVGSDVAIASAHSSLKSMLVNSASTELSSRHCFLLEDPPIDKEPTSSERDSKMEGDQDDRNTKQDKSMLDDKALSNDPNDRKVEDNSLEVKRQLASPDDEASEKPIALKEQAVVNHEEVVLDNCNDPSNSKLPNDQELSTVHDSDGSTPRAKIPPISEELGEGTLVKETCQPIEDLKDGHVPDALPSENKFQQSIKSNLVEEHPQPVETPKGATDLVSDSMPSDKSKPQKLISRNPVVESLETTDSVMDVDLVSNSLPSEKDESQARVTSISSQHTGTEKDVDMISSSVPLDKIKLLHLVKSNSGAENGRSTVAGEDHTENGTKVKDNSKKTKHDNNLEKVKHAAVSTLAAAAVKAKLLANQEEDEVRELASLLIEKQLHKLETKFAFFHDMENVMMRVKEHLVQSRQKLFHERALIIASRLGLPASASRGVPPTLPINRIPMNFANSVPRPQIILNSQRPPFSRPVGTIAPTLPSSLASTTAAGSSVRPSSQESLSYVGTK